MIRIISFCCFLAAMAAPTSAETPAIPCGIYPKPPVVSFVQMDRDIAIYMAKHTQRACAMIDNFARANPARMTPGLIAQYDNVKRKLQADVLEPIYAAYPGLRNVDVTQAPAGSFDARFKKEDGVAKRRELGLNESSLGEASARYLARVLRETKGLLETSADLKPVKLDDGKGFTGDFYRDLAFEIIFVNLPVYDRLRDSLERSTREAVSRPLSAAAAQRFRDTAPPVGSVRLSPGALAHIRALYDSVRKTPDGADGVIDISWVEYMGSKGPEDKEWTKYPPHVGLGGWSRRQVPADVIRYYDGIPIVFGGDTRERFAGKTIDLDGKNLVIKTR